MMKKIISLVLAVVMVFAMSVSVFAADLASGEINGATTGDVVIAIKGESGSEVAKVYKVDLAWDNLTFTYGGAKWNTETLKYENGTWDKASATITVTNKSNAAVGVAASMNQSSLNGVTATLTNPSFTLGSAESGTATQGTITVGVAGVPTTQDGFTLGTVTVALTK